MAILRRIFRWVRSKVIAFRELSNGDDLNQAQTHRGDYHELKSNPGGTTAGGGGM